MSECCKFLCEWVKMKEIQILLVFIYKAYRNLGNVTLPWDAVKCTINLFEKNSRVGLSQNHLLNILNFNTQKILLSIPWHLKYESYLNIYANFLEYTFTISRQAPSTYANAHSKYFKTWLIFVRDLQKKSQIRQ